MKIQKGNMAVIALIIVIVVATAGVIGWMFVKNLQPSRQEIVTKIPESIVPQLKNEWYGVVLGAVKINLPVAYRVQKTDVFVYSEGDVFSGVDNKDSFAWIIVPTSFSREEKVLFPQMETANAIPFFTFLSDVIPGDRTVNITDAKSLLDLSDGKFLSGERVAFELVSQENIGKNQSGDEVYAYHYIVKQAYEGQAELTPRREFVGAFWTHSNRMYILQDQTETSAYFEPPVLRAQANMVSDIRIIALSAEMVESNIK